tara:strand:+ start:574 stop:735 length:162 start_codon:yes stop_codon:yes gene_type:complete
MIQSKENKRWIEKRWIKFETSGCSLCWHHCSCDKPSFPPKPIPQQYKIYDKIT